MYKELRLFLIIVSEEFYLKDQAVKMLQQQRNVFYQSPGIKEFFYKENEVLMKNLSNDAIVLDVGCGLGTHAIMLSKYCKEVIGIDHSDAILAKCKKNVEGIANIKLLKMNARALEFDDNYFDETFSLFNTLGIMEEPLPVLKEMKRVTKPNKRIIFSLYNLNSINERIEFYKKTTLNHAHVEGTTIKSDDFFSKTYTEEDIKQLCDKLELNVTIHKTTIGFVCEATKQ